LLRPRSAEIIWVTMSSPPVPTCVPVVTPQVTRHVNLHTSVEARPTVLPIMAVAPSAGGAGGQLVMQSARQAQPEVHTLSHKPFVGAQTKSAPGPSTQTWFPRVQACLHTSVQSSALASETKARKAKGATRSFMLTVVLGSGTE